MNDISLKQAYEIYIFDRKTFCLDKTVQNYENTIRYFLEYMEEYKERPAGDIMLSDILNDDIKRYIIMLRQRPANANHPLKRACGRLSQRTIRNYTMDLKTFFQYLTEEGYCDNKFSGVKMIRAERKTIVPIFQNEVEILDKICDPKLPYGCRNYCMIHLMLDAGLRVSEVRKLRLRDIDIDNSYIHVIYGKGSKERTIPMSAKLRKYLYLYINVHRPSCQSETIFVEIGGDPLTENAMKSLFARMKKRSGIERLRPHLLRHTFATAYIMGGGSVEMLRILLGHESIETTQLYMHLAAVYNYQDNMYQLDPVFYRSRHRA